MPNHVENELWVSGPPDEVVRFVEGIKAKVDAKGEMSILTTYHPLPEELSDVTSGFITINDVDVQEWIDGPDGPIAISPELRTEYLEKYGATNWYDWAKLHWGTKWGDYFFAIKRESGATGAKFTFRSAWSPPLIGLATVSRMFPSLKFRLKHWECGSGVKGEFICRNGDVLLNKSEPYRGNRGG